MGFMPADFSRRESPMPDSCRSLGVWIAPAARMTSFFANNRDMLLLRPIEYNTLNARGKDCELGLSFSNIILVTCRCVIK